MSGMSPERLAEIEARVQRNRESRWFFVPQPIEIDVEDLLAEVKRLRAGIEHLTRVGYDHTPDCECERELAHLDWHPDCGLCWEDRLRALLNPTEGGTDADA